MTRPAAAFAPVLAVAAALALAACGRSDSQYFPLDPGATAIYEITLQTSNTGSARSENTVKSAAVMMTLAPEKIANETLIGHMDHDGRASYFRATKDGILWAGDQQPGDEMKFFKEEPYVLKFPLKAGTEWQVPSHIYLLSRVYLGSFGSVTRKLEGDIDLKYRVEATDETVKVAAGEFQHCVRVHGHGESTYDWGDPLGLIPLVVDQTEWYAPNVGLVKRVRLENPDPKSPASGKLVQELKSYDAPSWFD